ncbi:terminase small subunit [Escherichia coli]|nr:terminase small subunit [Escherichia coli]
MNISNSQVNRLRHFVRAGLRSLFRPEPQTAVEWADANYYLPKESAYQEGRWETLPFQRAIMNAMGSDYIREVNVVKSARVGYSKMLLGVYAYFIEHKQRNTLIWLERDAEIENEKLRREVEELRQASETDLQPGTIEYERHRLTRAQADAQELKNARDSAEVVETAFCTFVLSRIAGEIASILDGIPLSVQRRFPELENRHVDFLKRDIIKAMNKAAALDELIPGLLSEYIEQSG